MGYSKLELTNRTAVVIGATSGIGLALAKGLAQAGANVVATGRRAELVKQAAADIRKLGARSAEITCDVMHRDSVENLLSAVVKEFGAVDILVNCAGTTKRIPTLQMVESEWNHILETNLTGTLRACQVFGPHMIERKYGRIINIASITTFLALYEVTAYSASKAALGMLTKSLAIEWGRLGVCVNAIAPGFFRTEMNASLLDGTPRGQEIKVRSPMGRFGQVEELVGAAIFLASESASFVNGHVLVVDGGYLASGVNQ